MFWVERDVNWMVGIEAEASGGSEWLLIDVSRISSLMKKLEEIERKQRFQATKDHKNQRLFSLASSVESFEQWKLH
jgi:hypothetical protein